MRALNNVEGDATADYEDHQSSIDIFKLSFVDGLHALMHIYLSSNDQAHSM